MAWSSEEHVQGDLSGVPKFQMSDGAFHRIRHVLMETEKQMLPMKPRRVVTRAKGVLAVLSASIVAAVSVLVIEHQQPGKANPISTAPAATTFRYADYLSFQPVLPGETEGLQLSRSKTFYDDTGPAIANFSLYYGDQHKGFGVVEAADTPRIDSTAKWAQQFDWNGTPVYVRTGTMQGIRGTSVLYQKGGVTYTVYTHGDALTTTQLVNIAEHLNVPATDAPQAISISSKDPQEVLKVLSFKPFILPALQGCDLARVTADTERTASPPWQELSMEYHIPGHQYGFIVNEYSGKNDWAREQFARAPKVNIGGQNVYTVHDAHTMAPDSLAWFDSKTGILFEIPFLKGPGEPATVEAIAKTIIHELSK